MILQVLKYGDGSAIHRKYKDKDDAVKGAISYRIEGYDLIRLKEFRGRLWWKVEVIKTIYKNPDTPNTPCWICACGNVNYGSGGGTYPTHCWSCGKYWQESGEWIKGFSN